MRFELEWHHRNTPESELIEDLQRVATELGALTVTIDKYNERGRFHATTFTRRFGSWFRALELAGLEKTRNLNIPNETLFQNLLAIWTQLGHQPRYNDLVKPQSLYSSGTYEKRFGSWRKALEAFVSWANEGTASAPSPKLRDGSRRTTRVANWRQRAQILMRDGARCRLCGATAQEARLNIDHVISWSRGGETVIENLQVLCEQCNIGKSNLS